MVNTFIFREIMRYKIYFIFIQLLFCQTEVQIKQAKDIIQKSGMTKTGY